MPNHWTKSSKTSVYCMSHLFCIVGCSISQLAFSKSLYAWASAEAKRNKCLSSQRALTTTISITPVDQRHMTSAGKTINVFWNQMFLDVNWWIWPVCYLGRSLSADSPSVLFSYGKATNANLVFLWLIQTICCLVSLPKPLSFNKTYKKCFQLERKVKRAKAARHSCQSLFDSLLLTKGIRLQLQSSQMCL